MSVRKTIGSVVDQGDDGSSYRVHQTEDKVEPIIHLGLDEGAGVDDLDILGLVHHHSLVVLLPLPLLHLHQVGHPSRKVLVCFSDFVHPFALVIAEQLCL